VVDVETSRGLLQQFHELGLTNAAIAELTGLSRNNLQRISTGKTRTAHRRTEEALMELASRVTMRGRVIGAPNFNRPRALPHPRNQD
jgi:transcriptional regulator with XRE-family HTH domain